MKKRDLVEEPAIPELGIHTVRSWVRFHDSGKADRFNKGFPL